MRRNLTLRLTHPLAQRLSAQRDTARTEPGCEYTDRTHEPSCKRRATTIRRERKGNAMEVEGTWRRDNWEVVFRVEALFFGSSGTSTRACIVHFPASLASAVNSRHSRMRSEFSSTHE